MNRATRRLYGAACGSWACGVCAPIKRRQVIRRLRLGLEDPAATHPATRARLLTVTTNPTETFPVAAARLAGRFENLRRAATRETGVRFEYLAVAERGPRARRRVHLHVVFRGPWLPQAWWSMASARVGLGRVVDIRQVQTDAIASYAAKTLGGYLTKAADEQWPRHFRRVRASRRWSPAWVPYRPASSGEWIRMGVEPAYDPVKWVGELAQASREEARAP